MELVGKCGDLEVETLAIMLENDLDPKPVDPGLSVFLPQLPYSIPEHEIAKRLDLRLVQENGVTHYSALH